MANADDLKAKIGLSGRPSAPVSPPPHIPDHQMLRRIGQGSYGEVWLARSAVGTWRAVKVVYRDRFKDDRPYEREFAGIQKYEPFSRTNEGLVDVLQIGRNDAEAHFYYVMELADGACGDEEVRPGESQNQAPASGTLPRSPEGYTPRTLKHDLQRRGRVPTTECIEIGLTLNLALGHLHRHGLIHRDVKPANIIFVNGVPKLADIGLVTHLADAQSFVGTEGFIPPEGPNSPQADIYALGKVLYEASMGKDRQEFPEPFTGLGVDTASKALMELNAVLLKACAAKPKDRYASAEEMNADLALLQSGKSVLRLRKVEQRLDRFSKLSYAGIALTLLVVVAYLSSVRQARRADRAAAHALTEAKRADALAKAESEQRQRAEAALTHLQMQKAEDLFAADQAPSALAHLARLLRQQPTNHVAATRLLSALTYRNFPVPQWIVQHGDSILHVAFSPDGQRIATGSSDKTARFWDVQTGHPIFSPLEHPDVVRGVNFSPDGTKLATVCANTMRLWDITSGRLLLGPLSCDGRPWATTFSRDGRFFANVGWLTNVFVRDTFTGDIVVRIPVEGILVNSVSFAPDNQRLVTIGNGSAEYSPDGRWIVTCPPGNNPIGWEWDLRTGAHVSGPLYANPRNGHAVIWEALTGRLIASVPSLSVLPIAPVSPDSQRFATVTPLGGQVWDIRTGAAITTLSVGQPATLHRMEFSPEGGRIATSSEELARVWDAATGQPVTEPLQHPAIGSFQFGPDGQRLATYSKSGTLVLWDIRPGRALSLLLPHSNRVWRAHFSGDGNRLLTASWDQTARIWDTRTGQPVGLPMTHLDRVFGASFSADGLFVATADYRGGARLWDARSGRPVTDLLQHLGDVRSTQVSPDTRFVVTASSDKTARIWDAHTGDPIASLWHEHPVCSAVFHSDSRRVLTVASNLVQIWEIPHGRRLVGPLTLDQYSVGAVFSHDGQRFLTVTDRGTAQIYNTINGDPVTPSLRHRDKIRCGAFSPDDRLVGTASWDRTARIWDSLTGRALGAPLQHNLRVNWIAFSSDGRRVVTATLDNTARVWDVETGQPLTEPIHEGAEVATAEFSPDGKFIATSSAGNTAHIWEVPVAAVPVPSWLPDLAEALAQQRFNSENLEERVAISALLAIRKVLLHKHGNDIYTRWAKWFFADRSTRPISPDSAITVAEFIRRRLEENTMASLREAVRLSPNNGLAMARLALQVLQRDPEQSSRQTGEADFYSTRALELSPNDAEVKSIRAEILKRIGEVEWTRPRTPR